MFLSVAHLGLALTLLSVTVNRGGLDAALPAALVAGSLAVENGVIAAGGPLQRQGRLQIWSRWRYLLHGLMTPLLLPLGVMLLLEALGRPSAPLLAVAWLGAVLWAGADLLLRCRHLDLQPAGSPQLPRLRNRDRTGQPWLSLAPLAVVLVHGAAGVVLLVAWGWPWLLLGAVVMLVGGALGHRLGPLVSNGAELIFLAAVTATVLRLAGVAPPLPG